MLMAVCAALLASGLALITNSLNALPVASRHAY